jgi:hypothetical protein
MNHMRRKYPPWYKTVSLKPVTAFLTAAEKEALRKLAREDDKSLCRYVTRLLQKHVQETTQATRKVKVSESMSRETRETDGKN